MRPVYFTPQAQEKTQPRATQFSDAPRRLDFASQPGMIVAKLRIVERPPVSGFGEEKMQGVEEFKAVRVQAVPSCPKTEPIYEFESRRVCTEPMYNQVG